MMQRNESTTKPIDKSVITKRMLLGAGIGLVVILIFVLPVRHPNPDWGRFWMIRPIIVVPIAGAIGGLFSYVMDYFFGSHGWRNFLVKILSAIVFVVGIWMGIVLGLDGTMWN